MAADRSTPLHAAVALTLLLGACQVLWAWARAGGNGGPTAVGVAAGLAAVTLLAGGALARTDSFEARLGVALAVGAKLVVMLLAVTLGLPGQEPAPLGPETWPALALPAAVLGLLALDLRTRQRRSVPDAGSPSYAL